MQLLRWGSGVPHCLRRSFRTDPGRLYGGVTERGMFYADSIAGLLAHRTILHRRAKGHDELANDAATYHMG